MARSLSSALADYVVDWQGLPWPIRWSEVFGRSAPLALEIGFGNGAFLAEQARAHPARDHLGIELSWTAATYLFRRLRASGASNVRVLLGDAEALVRHHFAPRALSEVIVNHPCPWPKARHHGRRLLSRAFLELLAERMRPGARLTVVTDHAEFARWLTDELAAQRALESCHASAEVGAIAGRAPTKYQLKAMARGIPIHYFEWRKREGAPGEPPAAASEPAIPMPTLTLSGAVAPAELFRGFRPALFRERVRDGDQELEVVVKLEAVYRRTDPEPGAPVWLLETLVQEGRLRQQFALDVVARGATLLLKPSLLGQPYPTHGVKRALWCAAEWLRSRHPGLTVQHESLGLPAPAEPWPAG
jgi:tRNA (guanine-N7-)-methyltransferase